MAANRAGRGRANRRPATTEDQPGSRSQVGSPANRRPARHDRLHTQVDDQRPYGARDRDRVLYTSALRRLGGVTQVVAPEEGHIFHNRLTHTLEAAQIGRRIAENLLPFVSEEYGQVDPEIVDGALLAHDLGHPPFGHIAEVELDRLLLSAGVIDGYEGNAQSFRIVTKLCAHRQDYPGLNLSRAMLNGILKYPWFRQASGKRRNKW